MDPVDILVLTGPTLAHFCIVNDTVIGVMRMVDQGDADDEIIAVATYDERMDHIIDARRLATHTGMQVRIFSWTTGRWRGVR